MTEPLLEAAPTACERCHSPLASAALVCGGCQCLVHARRLEELSASARSHEERKELSAAHDEWQAALKLLPPEASQAAWVRTKVAALYEAVRQQAARETTPTWARRFGPFAPIVLFLLKGKAFLALLKLKFLFSFVTFAGFYWELYGFWFGVGLALLVLVHELGHFVEVRRRGLAVDLPMFIPGFGAYVRWNAAGVTPSTRAFISLAGPFAGLLGAVFCALVWLQTQRAVWIGLASFSAIINVFNLIPVWTLDGGQALVAVNRAGRIGIALAAVLFAAYFSQPLLLLVAGGAIYRAFEKASAEIPINRGVTAYFIVLVATLGYLSTLAPLGTLR